jgi:uncharacterized membrane protein
MNHEQQLARILGWFSIGLGLPQVAAPRGFAQTIGASGDKDSQALTRLVGARELVAGLGILAQPGAAGWLWARVAGDAMDLALLGSALAAPGTRKNRLVAATVAVLGVTVLDLRASLQMSRRSRTSEDQGARRSEEQSMNVKHAITVNRSPEELYQFWHDFQNLPRFMNHLESVQVTGPGRSHWKAKAPLGSTVEWDAEITEDRPNELIAWRSVAGADVDNNGQVRFVRGPAGRGTEVHVELRYNPPGGAIGATVAKFFGEEPNQQIQDDLRAFKQVMEIGEVLHSDASIHRRPHAAQPPSERELGR